MDVAGIVAFAAGGAVAGWFAPDAAAAVAEPRYGRESDAYDAEDDALAPLSSFGGTGQRVATAAALAAGLAAVAAQYALVAVVAVLAGMAVAVAVASLVDLRYLRLPDVLTFGSAAVGAAAVVAVTSLLDLDGPAVRSALVGAAVGAAAYAGFLLVVAVLFQAVRGRSGMGLGDVKLALPLGLLLGWVAGSGVDAVAMVVWAALVGNLLGIVGGVAITRLTPGTAFPFGPFLAAGWLLVLAVQPLR